MLPCRLRRSSGGNNPGGAAKLRGAWWAGEGASIATPPLPRCSRPFSTASRIFFLRRSPTGSLDFLGGCLDPPPFVDAATACGWALKWPWPLPLLSVGMTPRGGQPHVRIDPASRVVVAERLSKQWRRHQTKSITNLLGKPPAVYSLGKLIRSVAARSQAPAHRFPHILDNVTNGAVPAVAG